MSQFELYHLNLTPHASNVESKLCMDIWWIDINKPFPPFTTSLLQITTTMLLFIYTVKVYQHLTGTLLKNLITDIKCTENVSVMV